MSRDYQRIIDDIEMSEFYKWLELKNFHLSQGQCEMYLPLRENLLNSSGEVDQKVLYTAIDAASFAVACTLVPTEEIPVNCSVYISVLSASGSIGNLKIAARAIDSKAEGFIEVEVLNDNGEMVMVGNIRFKGSKMKP